MSLLFRAQRRGLGDTPNNLVPPRSGSSLAGGVRVTADTAMRNSAVWACVRLRAELVSTMPLGVFRTLPDGTTVPVPTPPVLVTPGGSQTDIEEWLYSSQSDLDRAGNTLGVITARDGFGFPSVIELQPLSNWSASMRKGVLTYRVGTTTYTPDEVWHERAYTTSGSPIGLSPIAYGAMTIGQYLTAQQYAMDWYSGSAIPTGRLKNTTRTVNPAQAAIVKDRFKAAVSGRDLFVHGSDWEYDPIQAESGDQAFLDTMKFSLSDTCRFFNVPADLIDAEQSGSSITYANMGQRNTQFLVMNLQPTLTRRERTFSRYLMVSPRFAQFDTGALLRMDPQTLATVMATKINSRQLAPSEVRAMDNREPYTEDQYEEIGRLFAKITDKGTAPTAESNP